MTVYTVQAAKTQLSGILHDVERGQEVTIARGRVPVARLIPIAGPELRRFGHLRFEVPGDFDAPLSDEELAAWE